jgi:hypothetical protein
MPRGGENAKLTRAGASRLALAPSSFRKRLTADGVVN